MYSANICANVGTYGKISGPAVCITRSNVLIPYKFGCILSRQQTGSRMLTMYLEMASFVMTGFLSVSLTKKKRSTVAHA